MPSRKVLVVDDSQVVRRQVALALNLAGYDVVEAVDGVDGRAKFDESVAMVILDVSMPRMSGLELLEAIKRDAKNASVPVMMLTTEGDTQMIERAKSAGAKGWIIKPFKPELLVAAVTKLVTAR